MSSAVHYRISSEKIQLSVPHKLISVRTGQEKQAFYKFSGGLHRNLFALYIGLCSNIILVLSERNKRGAWGILLLYSYWTDEKEISSALSQLVSESPLHLTGISFPSSYNSYTNMSFSCRTTGFHKWLLLFALWKYSIIAWREMNNRKMGRSL